MTDYKTDEFLKQVGSISRDALEEAARWATDPLEGVILETVGDLVEEGFDPDHALDGVSYALEYNMNLEDGLPSSGDLLSSAREEAERLTEEAKREAEEDAEASLEA